MIHGDPLYYSFYGPQSGPSLCLEKLFILLFRNLKFVNFGTLVFTTLLYLLAWLYSLTVTLWKSTAGNVSPISEPKVCENFGTPNKRSHRNAWHVRIFDPLKQERLWRLRIDLQIGNTTRGNFLRIASRAVSVGKGQKDDNFHRVIEFRAIRLSRYDSAGLKSPGTKKLLIKLSWWKQLLWKLHFVISTYSAALNLWRSFGTAIYHFFCFYVGSHTFLRLNVYTTLYRWKVYGWNLLNNGLKS